MYCVRHIQVLNKHFKQELRHLACDSLQRVSCDSLLYGIMLTLEIKVLLIDIIQHEQTMNFDITP